MAEKIKIDPKWDRLTQEAARAANAGMSYGKWKAAQYAKDQAHLDRLRAITRKKEEEADEEA